MISENTKKIIQNVKNTYKELHGKNYTITDFILELNRVGIIVSNEEIKKYIFKDFNND